MLQNMDLNNPPAHSQKLTFLQLRNQCHFDILTLAQQANVRPEIVYRMLLHKPVPHNLAVMVLHAFSEHAHKRYILAMVDIPIAI